MREQLQNKEGQRQRFTATFVRFGTKSGYKGRSVKTLLFEHVVQKGAVVCDHIWFTTNKTFEELNLTEGMVISFDARVKPYWKGYKGRRNDDDLPPISKDYKLKNPTRIKVHGEGKQLEMKL